MEDKSLVITGFVVLFIAVACLIYSSPRINPIDKGFKISELEEGVGYQICTASVEAPFLLCDDEENNFGFQIDDKTTQEQLDNFIGECNDVVVMDGSFCDGNLLEIRGR